MIGKAVYILDEIFSSSLSNFGNFYLGKTNIDLFAEGSLECSLYEKKSF